MASEYITSRGNLLSRTEKEMQNEDWYNMWSSKLWPFEELSTNDILYWYDSKKKMVVWRSRIRMIERTKYSSKKNAEHFLNKHDVNVAGNEYFEGASSEGYCILFRVDQVRKCELKKPADFSFPRNGWLRADDAQKAGWLFEATVKGKASRKTFTNLQIATKQLEAEEYFRTQDAVGEMKRVLREIAQRRGQSLFRRKLLSAYSGRCAITGCDAVDALEAAHIVPYAERLSNRISNGLLLRADIHTLFDLNLIGVNPSTHLVTLSTVLLPTDLKGLRGVKIRLPKDPQNHPEMSALKMRWERFLAVNSRK